LLHHHDQERPLTEAEREQLLKEGATYKGMVSQSDLSPADRRISQVRVRVRFKDGGEVEFGEELANLYQPASGSQEAQRLAEVRGAEQLRHPDRIPKIQIPLSAGEMVPVRYDAAHPTRMVLDVPAMQKRALHDYIQREQQAKQQKPDHAPTQAGPPWAVPTHCPNCGAPVDQATASSDSDPRCEFCHEPLPVSPLR
jgi:hypothetical protein